MMQNDLKMHIIDFNENEQKLEIVSTFKLDQSIVGGGPLNGGKQLKEVSYVSFDRNLKTIVIVFA